MSKSIVKSIVTWLLLFSGLCLPLSFYKTEELEVKLNNQTLLEAELSQLTNYYFAFVLFFSFNISLLHLFWSFWLIQCKKEVATKVEIERLRNQNFRLNSENVMLKTQELKDFQ